MDRIGHRAVEPCAKPDHLLGLFRQDATGGVGVVRDQDDVIFHDVLAQFDRTRAVWRNRQYLCLGLRWREGGVDARSPCARVRLSQSRSACRLGRAGEGADHDMVEGKAELSPLRARLFGKADRAQPAILCTEAQRRQPCRNSRAQALARGSISCRLGGALPPNSTARCG